MDIRFFIIAALALAFILPVAHYAKALDFKDRPVFLRRIEEKLAFFFPNIFVNVDKNNQIDYGFNVDHEPAVIPEPPKVAAKIQQRKANFSAAPAILAQDWKADVSQPPVVESGPVAIEEKSPPPAVAFKETEENTAPLVAANTAVVTQPVAEDEKLEEPQVNEATQVATPDVETIEQKELPSAHSQDRALVTLNYDASQGSQTETVASKDDEKSEQMSSQPLADAQPSLAAALLPSPIPARLMADPVSHLTLLAAQ